MRPGTAARVLLCALALGTLAACGSNDDTDTDTAATTEAPAAATNTLAVEMVDYGYKVDGEVGAGLVTFSSTNAGKEMHMAGVGKLKAGKTVADVIAATKVETKEGEDDPVEALLEDQIDKLGHTLFPGASQAITTEVDAGDYVMICYIPTEGEGMPHFAKGMVAGFTVGAEKSDVAEPEADVEITLADEAEPAGVPADLKAGSHTFKITATGKHSKEFAIGQFPAGKSFAELDAFFEGEYGKEGGPAKGVTSKAPGSIAGIVFALEANETVWMTVDLKAGEAHFLNATNIGGGDSEEEPVDKITKVKVS